MPTAHSPVPACTGAPEASELGGLMACVWGGRGVVIGVYSFGNLGELGAVYLSNYLCFLFEHK